MSTVSSSPTTVTAPATTSTPAARVVSIDIFRGLTMAVMIFVNDLGEVRGLPWWTYHAHAQQDLMTYVDMVFPFFLFIVGMSMPLAIERRLKQNPSHAALWLHVALRSCGLIVLGLILANAEKVDPARTHMSGLVWGLLGLAGGILVWLVPDRNPRHRSIYRTLRIVGVLLLVFVFAIFRRITPNGSPGWIDGSYPEILGLIGYTYFSVALLYIPTRRWTWAPLFWFAALTAFCALVVARLIHWPAHLPLYIWPFSNGAHPALTMAGIATTTILLRPDSRQTLRSRIMLAFAFGVAMLVAAWLLTPLGISKIRATPTWLLVSSGAAVLSFLLLYWICDLKGWRRWAALVKPAGENTLLTYLLPDIYYFCIALFGFRYFETHLRWGTPGVIRSIVFTLLILAVSGVLTRRRIRLQL
jgi:heparan-alpha-glucosaminide N-acetyltransferase